MTFKFEKHWSRVLSLNLGCTSKSYGDPVNTDAWDPVPNVLI